MPFKIKTLSVILASVISSWVQAQEATTISLDTIEAKGILPDKLEAVPGAFSVVDEGELESRRPFSIKEALGVVSGINILQNEDPLGLAQNIGVRGMDPRRTARTLLLEDGMPLFLAPYGDPSSHYIPMLERVQRIEVVKGSGQVLYGPQTVGGMINFVTRPIPKDGFAGTIVGALGNNDYSGVYANLGFGGERGGIMVDLSKKQGDGIRDNHEFDVEDYTLKGILNLTESQTLLAKLGYYKEDSHVSETGLGAVDYDNNKYQAPSGNNDSFKHERKSAQLVHKIEFAEKVKLTTQVYYVDAWRSSFRQTDAPGGYDEDAPGSSTGVTVLERCDTPGVPFTEAQADACGGRHRPRSYTYLGIEPRLDFSHNLFGIENDAVLGFRYHEEDITRKQYRGNSAAFQSLSYAKANVLPREHIKIDVETKSYYAQNTFYVGDWALTPGVRVEDIKIKTDVIRAGGDPHSNPESKLTNNQTEVLPGFGVAWNGIAHTTMFGGVHKGFAPPRPDRDLRSDGADTAVVDKTKPETSLNWELGVRSRYFKGINFESTLFYTKFDDIVVKSGAGEFDNGGEAAMAGLEFAGRVDFGTIYNSAHNFYITANYTNLFTAKFKKSSDDPLSDGIVRGDRLPYAPKYLASVNFGYQHPIGLDMRIGVDYISEQKEDAPFRDFVLNAADPTGADARLSGLSGDIPSYTLFNASVNFKPAGSKATYFVSGHNLTDREYLASRVDGMSAGRGRQIFGGVRYDF